jgi:hypothetical protein
VGHVNDNMWKERDAKDRNCESSDAATWAGSAVRR